ncbi:MAG: O-antigen polymerase [Bacteroidota bacterium]
MELIFIFLLFLVTWLNYKYFGKVMSPGVLFSGLWAAVFLLHFIFSYTLLKDLYDLSFNTMALFFGGVIAFTAGCFLYHFFHQPTFGTQPGFLLNEKVIPPFSFKIRLLLVLLCAVALPFFIRTAIQIFIQSQLDNFLLGLRYELSYNDADLGPLKYMITFSIVIYALCQMEALRNPVAKNKILAFASFLIAFVFAVFSSGRTFFMLLGTIYLGLQFILNPLFKIKRILLVIPVVILLFAGYGLIFGKGSETGSNLSDNIRSVSEYTALYFVGSLNAQDYELNHQFEPVFNGYNSLRFFYVVGSALGFIPPVKFSESLTRDYVQIPYDFNVYTFYSPYLKDFGYLYPIVFLFVIGFIHTWLYIKAMRTGSPRYALYYGVMLYPLIMSFFQDQYLSLLSTWIQFVIIIESAFLFNKLFIKVTNTSISYVPASPETS